MPTERIVYEEPTTSSHKGNRPETPTNSLPHDEPPSAFMWGFITGMVTTAVLVMMWGEE